MFSGPSRKFWQQTLKNASKTRNLTFVRAQNHGKNSQNCHFAALPILLTSAAIAVTEEKKEQTIPTSWKGFELTIYMYYGCPFCSKLEAYLRFNKIPYNQVEVNALTQSEVKAAGKPYNYKKVPLVIVRNVKTGDSFALKDSSRVISIIESLDKNSDQTWEKLQWLNEFAYPEIQSEDPKNPKKTITEFPNKFNIMIENHDESQDDQIKLERKWRKWVEKYVLHTIAPNLYRNWTESLQSTQHFIDISPKFGGTWTGSTIVYSGGAVMKVIGGIVKKRYNISADPREDLYNHCNYWVKNIPKDSRLMSGTETPSIADIELFGILATLEGTPVWADLLKNSKIIQRWYTPLKKLIKSQDLYPRSDKYFIAPASI